MADPVSGVVGSLSIGTVPVAINKALAYKFKSTRDKTERGPWIGDAAKVTTVGGKLGEMTVNGDVIIGGDPGVQDAVDAYENGTTDLLVCTTEDGYTITFTAPAYTDLAIEGDASEGQTWEFTVSGAYTITQDT